MRDCCKSLCDYAGLAISLPLSLSLSLYLSLYLFRSDDARLTVSASWCLSVPLFDLSLSLTHACVVCLSAPHIFICLICTRFEKHEGLRAGRQYVRICTCTHVPIAPKFLHGVGINSGLANPRAQARRDRHIAQDP